MKIGKKKYKIIGSNSTQFYYSNILFKEDFKNFFSTEIILN